MTRSPDRIDDMLAALKRAWVKHPDLRLGQLVTNASYFDASGQNIGQTMPLVLIEDEDLLNGLRGVLVAY